MADMTTEQARWYLAGMFDGEGSFDRNIRRPPRTSCIYKVRIPSCDQELIDSCSAALDVLGIEHKVYVMTKGGGAYKSGRPRRQAWQISVHKIAAVLKFGELVPFTHRKKRERMEHWAADIGKPERTIEIEPLREPVPTPAPAKEPAPARPVEEPVPA